MFCYARCCWCHTLHYIKRTLHVGRVHPQLPGHPLLPERQEPGGRSLWDAFTTGHLRSATVSTSRSEACGGVKATGVPSEQQQTGELTRSRRHNHRGPRGRSPFARGWGRDGLGSGQALACSVGCGERRCTTEFIFYIFRGCCKAAAEPAGCRAPGAGGPAALEGAAPLNRGDAEQGIPLAARHPRQGNPRWRSATQMPIFGTCDSGRHQEAPAGRGRGGEINGNLPAAGGRELGASEGRTRDARAAGGSSERHGAGAERGERRPPPVPTRGDRWAVPGQGGGAVAPRV